MSPETLNLKTLNPETRSPETRSPELPLALGTAQLGMPYGVANRSGQPDAAEARAIVAAAWRAGVRWFDTAEAYGESEEVVGRCLRELGVAAEARVVGKLHPETPPAAAGEIRARVEASFATLGVPRLAGLLLHREELLESWDGCLGETLLALRDGGRVARLGVSVYGVDAARRALDEPAMEILQLPLNVFDRRMHRSGVLERAARQGRRVFVRSVYLQGLALMDPEKLPAGMELARDAVVAYRAFCRERGVDRRAFALAYVRQRAPRACLVVGAESRAQVEENARLLRQAAEVDVEAWDRRWPEDRPELVNPARWPAAEAS